MYYLPSLDTNKSPMIVVIIFPLNCLKTTLTVMTHGAIGTRSVPVVVRTIITIGPSTATGPR